MEKSVLYFVGIKGTGMSALAQCLYDIGYQVIGSDVSDDYKTSSGLLKRNITILPFNAENIKPDYLYIIGNAYDDNHIEVKKIKENHYEYYYYHEWIGNMSGFHIAICGTHGKTTTTSLIAHLLSDSKIAYVIGDGSGGGTTNYKYFIYEACEYRNHFFAYYPEILIINNIELDHPDFFKSIEDCFSSFQHVAKQASFVFVNGDDEYSSLIKHGKRTTFGKGEKNDISIKVLSSDDKGFDVQIGNDKYRLPFVGDHMLYNSLIAIIIAKQMGMSPTRIQKKLLDFVLPRRRMETVQKGNTILIDDYAHHPTEIKALHQALRQKYPDYTLNVIFQSHTYSRTLTFQEEFIKVLSLFDHTYIEKVFSSAREKEQIELQKQVDSIFSGFHKFTPEVLNEIKTEEKAVWIFLGAGTVNHYLEEWLEKSA